MDARVFSGVLVLLLGACTAPFQSDYQSAMKMEEKGEYHLALSSLEKIVTRSPDSEVGLKSAREAARLSFFELKDFEKAAEFYRVLVYHSPDPEERLRAQKQVTSVYLEHLNNYERSIVEINKLLPILRDSTERMKFKMDLARAYYYQNNFFQAEMEVDEFLRISKNDDQIFQMTLLRANIALARKDLSRAANILKELLKRYPQRAQKENVGLTLAVAYEEMKDYRSAITVLQDTRDQHAMPDFIDLRIKKLQERLKNAPGARGFRK